MEKILGELVLVKKNRRRANGRSACMLKGSRYSLQSLTKVGGRDDVQDSEIVGARGGGGGSEVRTRHAI